MIQILFVLAMATIATIVDANAVTSNGTFCEMLNGRWITWSSSRLTSLHHTKNDDATDATNDGAENDANVVVGSYEFTTTQLTSMTGKVHDESTGIHTIGSATETFVVRCIDNNKGLFYSTKKRKARKLDSTNNEEDSNAKTQGSDDDPDAVFDANSDGGEEDTLLFEFDLQAIATGSRFSQGLWKPNEKSPAGAGAVQPAVYQLIVDYPMPKFSLLVSRYPANAKDDKSAQLKTTLIIASKIVPAAERSFYEKWGPLVALAIIMAVNGFIRIQASRYKTKTTRSVAPGPAIASAAAAARKAGAEGEGEGGKKND